MFTVKVFIGSPLSKNMTNYQLELLAQAKLDKTHLLEYYTVGELWEYPTLAVLIGVEMEKLDRGIVKAESLAF